MVFSPHDMVLNHFLVFSFTSREKGKKKQNTYRYSLNRLRQRGNTLLHYGKPGWGFSYHEGHVPEK